jgi:hypothetical protein
MWNEQKETNDTLAKILARVSKNSISSMGTDAKKTRLAATFPLKSGKDVTLLENRLRTETDLKNTVVSFQIYKYIYNILCRYKFL